MFQEVLGRVVNCYAAGVDVLVDRCGHELPTVIESGGRNREGEFRDDVVRISAIAGEVTAIAVSAVKILGW
ncbi:hypothetical protein GCM10027572_35740 [Flexivirga lutea]